MRLTDLIPDADNAHQRINIRGITADSRAVITGPASLMITLPDNLVTTIAAENADIASAAVAVSAPLISCSISADQSIIAPSPNADDIPTMPTNNNAPFGMANSCALPVGSDVALSHGM